MNSRSIGFAAVDAPFTFSEAPAPELPDVMALTAFATGGVRWNVAADGGSKYRVRVTGGTQWRPNVA